MGNALAAHLWGWMYYTVYFNQYIIQFILK
jgi:hypothetical protein